MFMAKYTACAAPSAFGSSPDRGAKTLVVIWFRDSCYAIDSNAFMVWVSWNLFRYSFEIYPLLFNIVPDCTAISSSTNPVGRNDVYSRLLKVYRVYLYR